MYIAALHVIRMLDPFHRIACIFLLIGNPPKKKKYEQQIQYSCEMLVSLKDAPNKVDSPKKPVSSNRCTSGVQFHLDPWICVCVPTFRWGLRHEARCRLPFERGALLPDPQAAVLRLGGRHALGPAGRLRPLSRPMTRDPRPTRGPVVGLRNISKPVSEPWRAPAAALAERARETQIRTGGKGEGFRCMATETPTFSLWIA